MRHQTAIRRAFFGLVLVLASLAPAVAADDRGRTIMAASQIDVAAIAPLRTDSAAHTLATFTALREELTEALSAYNADRSSENFAHLVHGVRRIRSLIDVRQVATASQDQVAMEAAFALLDIFDRIPLPSPEAVPTDGGSVYALPSTPFRILFVEDGPRRGEFLFSGDAVAGAPRFLRGIQVMPRLDRRPFDSWTDELRGLSGPMIPVGLVALLPGQMSTIWLDNPIWKTLALFLLASGTAVLMVVVHVAIRALRRRVRAWSSLALGLATAALTVVALALLESFVELQLNIGGRLDDAFKTALAIRHIAYAWALWLVCALFAETLISFPSIREASTDASLLRLCARILAAAGGVVIIAHGAQDLGVPVFSVLAGLGVGGLAAALAVRPSLENLVAGFVLYLDRPFRVGDFCQFGDRFGTVDRIGMRSTQIRALDRTLVSMPNAQLADTEIVNWAQCDKMMIERTIGLRYETDPDQLRWVLARIRAMFHAHPRIDNDTVRVRFAGHGESSLDIEIRVYALTREWNDFFAVREDVLLRVTEIVARSGTSFAFPSRTVYAATDHGVDADLGNRAKKQVERWRETGALPFPRLPEETLERLRGKLDYPPRGSPGYLAGDDAGDDLWSDTAEPLSADDRSPSDSDIADRKEREARAKPDNGV